VSVRGRFNGATAEASAQAALSVQARNWNGVLPQGHPTPVEIGQGTGKWALASTPDADSLLRRVLHGYVIDPATEQPVVAPFYNDGSLVVITQGPNGGLSIFGRVPNLLSDIEVQINLVALAKDSHFWRAQPVSPAPPACPQSVVTAASTKDKIRVHEGTTFQSGSHTARFRAAYEQFVGPAFESFIAPNNEEQASFGPLAVAVLKQLKDKADEADQFNRVRWGSGNGCNFNFNYLGMER
jgi:hypothetical protein